MDAQNGYIIMQSDSRKEAREKTKEIEKRMRLPPGKFKEVILRGKSIPDIPKCVDRGYFNNRYNVLVVDSHNTTNGPCIRAIITRLDGSIIPNHWSEIQKIKNEIFGEEVMAIEYYPKQSDLKDAVNAYGISIFPEGVIPVLTETITDSYITPLIHIEL